MEKTGLIGVGVMGLTAAQRLLEGGTPVLVYDSSDRACHKARQIGAEVASSLEEVASSCQVILMFLPGPEQVSACVGGLLLSCGPGSVLVDMSTVDPKTSVRMAQLARKRGVGYLDAPVLGRPVSVGRWALPVGGAEEDLGRCMPVLSLLAARVIYVGESGCGNKIKLLNQMMFGAINAMTAEMMAVSERVGISPKFLFDTITSSQAGTVSNLFLELGRKISAEDYDDPTFSVDLLCKDLRLAVEMAQEKGAPPVLARTIQFINEVAQAQGLGAKDTSIMWKVFRKIWGEDPGPRQTQRGCQERGCDE